MSLFSLTLVLFLIMDPLGHIKSFISYLEGIKPKRQKFIIAREMVIALIAMLFFNFMGEHLLSLLDISMSTIYLTSGIILFLVAIKILFPKSELIEHKKNGDEPFLVPLAIPMIAGPALLATIMLFASTEESVSMMLLAVFIAWISTSIILLFSKQILRVIGTGGLTACERLMGMVLVLLSIQRIMQGIILVYSNATATS